MRLVVKEKDIYNEEILKVYKKYGNTISSIYKYLQIMESRSYLWFILVNDNDELIGECSISNRSRLETKLEVKSFELHNVYIVEKFRGNNYALLMILNVLYYLDKNYQEYNYIIKAYDDNYAAIKTYKKIVGDPIYRNGFAIFEYNHFLLQ